MPALTVALDAVWRQTPAGCVQVRNGDTVVYEADADAAVAPASVVKLLTAVAALDVLGEDTRLRTTVVAASAPVDGVVPGDLWLVGGGDPVLETSQASDGGAEAHPFTPLGVFADVPAVARCSWADVSAPG